MPLLALVLALGALSPAQVDAFVARARATLGTPYILGGRLKPQAYGIDCQGVLFFAAAAVSPCGWKSYSVMSTVAVATGELGTPVPGLSPISMLKLDVARLQRADIVFVVGYVPNPFEAPIAEIDGKSVWVWHTGLYAGDGKWIVGDHYARQVVETPLVPYLFAHSDVYAGVYILRMTGPPKPPKCRKHAPMRLHD